MLHAQLRGLAQGRNSLFEQAEKRTLTVAGRGMQMLGELRLEVDDARVGREQFLVQRPALGRIGITFALQIPALGQVETHLQHQPQAGQAKHAAPGLAVATGLLHGKLALGQVDRLSLTRSQQRPGFGVDGQLRFFAAGAGEVVPVAGGEGQTQLTRTAEQTALTVQQYLNAIARQQVSIHITGTDADALGMQLRQPALEQVAAHRQQQVAAVGQGFTKGQVQLLNIFGEQILHRVGQRLAQPAGLVRGQLHRTGADHFHRQHQRQAAARQLIGAGRPAQGQPRAVGRLPVQRGCGAQLGTAVGGQKQAVVHGCSSSGLTVASTRAG